MVFRFVTFKLCGQCSNSASLGGLVACLLWGICLIVALDSSLLPQPLFVTPTGFPSVPLSSYTSQRIPTPGSTLRPSVCHSRWAPSNHPEFSRSINWLTPPWFPKQGCLPLPFPHAALIALNAGENCLFFPLLGRVHLCSLVSSNTCRSSWPIVSYTVFRFTYQ